MSQLEEFCKELQENAGDQYGRANYLTAGAACAAKMLEHVLWCCVHGVPVERIETDMNDLAAKAMNKKECSYPGCETMSEGERCPEHRTQAAREAEHEPR